MTEERYKQLVEYLQEKRHGSLIYPPHFTSNEKRALRQQAATFDEKDGVLFHTLKGPSGEKLFLRVVANDSEKNRLIHVCHDGIDGGHFGQDKTLSQVCVYAPELACKYGKQIGIDLIGMFWII